MARSNRKTHQRSRAKRREYLRSYLRWLWPYRYSIGALFALALTGAGLQMIEPLFMRYIIDQILRKPGLDAAACHTAST